MGKKIKTILGIDLEGINKNLTEEGVNILEDRVTEIGAVLWDCQLNQPVKIFSKLIDEADKLPIPPEIEDLTGISDEMLLKWGLKKDNIKKALEKLSKIMDDTDYIMAHNGNQYDKPMLGAMFNRYGVPLPSTIWIDSAQDIEFPAKIRGRNMPLLEHAHGFINPFPHRAVTDVLAMLKIATNYDIKRMAKLAESPKVTIVAKLKAPNWKDREEVNSFNIIKNKVSKARFKWNPDSKTWTKIVPKLLLDEDSLKLDFNFVIKED